MKKLVLVSILILAIAQAHHPCITHHAVIVGHGGGEVAVHTPQNAVHLSFHNHSVKVELNQSLNTSDWHFYVNLTELTPNYSIHLR